MKINKAVITAASPEHRTLPIQSLIDHDGVERSVIEILLNEVQSAGIEDVCVIVHPGDAEAYQQAASGTSLKLHFIEQTERRGYGHALSLAADFTAGESFLHSVCDHLFISRDPEKSCARQLVESAKREGCAISAVQSTRETEIQHYGAVAGDLQRGSSAHPLYAIREVIEKPTPTIAEQKLIVPGLRSGRYLTFFGMHVLTPTVMTLLKHQTDSGADNIQLSPVLAELAKREQYGALLIQGDRHHVSLKYGLFRAQLALALAGQEREQILSDLLELVAHSRR